MKVALIHNRDRQGVINVLEVQNRETYDPTTLEAVASALESGGHNVRVIEGNMHVIDQLREFMPRVVAGERQGMVFNMAYGIQGVSRYTHLPAILEMLGVPYIGSNPQAHSLALDKIVAKLLFENHDIPTPKYWNVGSADAEFEGITFPVIVKPKMEAASLGLRVVREEKDLREAVDEIVRRYAQHALVEEFIPGREFTIGLLGNGDIEVLPVVELNLEGDPQRLRDDEEEHPLEKICPADLPAEKTAELQDLARRSFQALGINDYGRIDVRMDEQGHPFVLEINSMADLGQDGAYVFGAKAAGYDFDSLINRILDVAAIRYFGADPKALDAGFDTKVAAASNGSMTGQLRGYLRSHASTFEDELRQMVTSETDRWDRLVARLHRLGFSESAPRPKGDVATYFTNHREEENDILLVVHRPSARDRRRTVEFREEGNRLYGTGIARSHAHVETLLASLEALKFVRPAKWPRCGILFCTKRQGKDLQSTIETVARRSRRVVGVSESDEHGSVVLSRPGQTDYQMELASAGPEAVAQLCARVAAIVLKGGKNGEAKVDLDRMAISADSTGTFEESFARVKGTFTTATAATTLDQEIDSLLTTNGSADAAIELTRVQAYPVMAENEASRALFEGLEVIGKECNIQIRGISERSPSELCFVPDEIPTLDGLGPAVGGSDGSGEYVFRYSIVDRALLLALLVQSSSDAD